MKENLSRSDESDAWSARTQADFAAYVQQALPQVSRGEDRLYRRIYDWIRAAILDGALPGGTRLPPGRALASQLGVSRNTVSNAFDQLLAEGFIEGRAGSGTFVAELPSALFQLEKNPTSRPDGRTSDKTNRGGRSGPAGSVPGLSKRGGILAALRVTRARSPGIQGNPDASGAARPFGPGVPGLDQFPFSEFARITTKVYRQMQASPASFGYAAPAGISELREAIAVHLRIDRGVRCEADQIVVVNGSQEGLDLCARLLLDPGDVALVENPGYLGARAAFAAAGAKVVGVPVHPDSGLDLRALKKFRLSKSKRSILYVTPSHQFPLGMTMSLSARLELLEFARESGTLLLEDDYDSEYRYNGRPISALQGLDEGGRSVVYVGTFSKVLAPGLRLGYLVLPPYLVDAFVSTRALMDRQPPTIAQHTVARFMMDGGFHRHLRRMRELYRERREILLHGICELPGQPLQALPSDTGLHVTARLSEEYLSKNERNRKPRNIACDQILSNQAAEAGIDLPALSNYFLEPQSPGAIQGLLFGFAAYERSEMQAAFRELRRLF